VVRGGQIERVEYGSVIKSGMRSGEVSCVNSVTRETERERNGWLTTGKYRMEMMYDRRGEVEEEAMKFSRKTAPAHAT